ncbi:hypothetical protein VARIO8X_120111 [Burkholderiales bacterium 8X]|nr:hypothetical protein VARIO8X_120111 [Burkholderiales bacterium 8X]
MPSPRRQHRRGPCLCRKPHPQGNHRGRGHPARPGCHQHVQLGQPGHGPGRRGHPSLLADGPQDEGAARLALAGRRFVRRRRHTGPSAKPQRQLPRQALCRQVHDQPGHRPRHLARGGQHRSRQVGRPGGLEAGLLRRQAVHDPEGWDDCHGRDGRRERVDPDAPAGALPADVRRLRRLAREELAHLRLAGRLGQRHRPALRPAEDGECDPQRARHSQAGHGAQRLHATDGDRSANLRGAGRRPAADLRPRRDAAADAALLSVLDIGGGASSEGQGGSRARRLLAS